MKALKPYLTVTLLAIAAISFIVMVFGFFVRPSVTGFIAIWVFGFSFSFAIFLNLPDDMGKRDGG